MKRLPISPNVLCNKTFKVIYKEASAFSRFLFSSDDYRKVMVSISEDNYTGH